MKEPLPVLSDKSQQLFAELRVGDKMFQLDIMRTDLLQSQIILIMIKVEEHSAVEKAMPIQLLDQRVYVVETM